MIKLLSMDKIQALLKKSNLVLEEQNELLAALKLLPSTELNELYNFLKNHPEWVDKLYQNYKQKKSAATLKDNKKWQDIFKKEEEELKKL